MPRCCARLFGQKRAECKPFSADVALCDIFLITWLKILIRGKCFESIEDIKKNSLKELNAVLQSDYEECVENWVLRWDSCIELDRSVLFEASVYIHTQNNNDLVRKIASYSAYLFLYNAFYMESRKTF